MIWLGGFFYFFLCALCVFAVRASYHNGCVDGYGAAKEPENPGYQAARRYLKEHMSHRWEVK